jgi:hypothetical protein
MNRVVHFEIKAGDPERAAKFYSAVFGWEIKEWVIPGVEVPDENRYWLVTTGPEGETGINGGISYRQGPPPLDGQPLSGFECTVDVTNLDRSVEKALKAGARLARPKMPVMGIGWLAYCYDTEGNIFGMMEADPEALISGSEKKEG